MVTVNASMYLFHKILDENGGSMMAEDLLKEHDKRLPAFLRGLKKSGK